MGSVRENAAEDKFHIDKEQRSARVFLDDMQSVFQSWGWILSKMNGPHLSQKSPGEAHEFNSFNIESLAETGSPLIK